MKSSIIIVNRNGANFLRVGLPSVIAAVRYTGVEHEIIVVDDGSQDESVRVIRKEFPEVKLVALNQNQGFGKACNIGVEHSQNPIVIMLNNDMVVEEDFLNPLLTPFINEDIFAVACQVKKWDKQTIEIGLTRAKFKFGFIKINRNVNLVNMDIPQSTFFASGGAAAYSKEKYLILDGFDELYHPFYWEDVDLSYRAWKRGWQVFYQPHSVVYHKHQGTIGKSFKKSYVKEIYYRNRFLFIWRNITDWHYLKQHFFWLLPYLLINMLIGKFYYLRGLCCALQKISQIKEKKKIDKDLQRISDINIF